MRLDRWTAFFMIALGAVAIGAALIARMQERLIAPARLTPALAAATWLRRVGR